MHEVSSTGPSAASIISGKAEAICALSIVTIVSRDPSSAAASVACVRSSGPARSRPIVNDGTAWPRCRLLRPSTTVESSPPLM